MEGYWARKEWIEQGIDYYKACLTYDEVVEACKYLPNQVETIKLKKLVRYYYSTDSNWQLFKRGTGSTGKPMNVNQAAPNELGTIYIQYFNKFENKPFDDYKVDLNQYIYKTYKIIAKVEKNKKDKNFIANLSKSKQMSLF